MLSQGGSRLNASKPEANPKTRYPTPKQTSQHNPRLPPWCVLLADSRPTCVNLVLCKTKPFGIYGKLNILCFAAYLFAFVVLVKSGILLNAFSIESPHKPSLPAQPRWRQVSHMITRSYQILFTHTPDVRFSSQTSIPKRRRHPTPKHFHNKRPSPNERTCIGWHKRYASVSGRSSRGIYVPRR
jgi:hypothetical protein